MFILGGDKIYGFSFGESLVDIDFDQIHDKLLKEYGTVDNIVLSLHEDESEDVDNLWVVASDKHLDGDKIATVIAYLIDNELLYDYILTDSF